MNANTFFPAQLITTDFGKISMIANIIKMQNFHKIKYDLKG